MRKYVGLFSHAVAKRRIELRMTLEQVGRKIGSHKGYICGIERAKVAPPTIRYIRKMAALYGMDLKPLAMMAWLEKAPEDIREEAVQLVTQWIEKDGKNGLK